MGQPGRLLSLGFGSTTIAPGAVVKLTARPQIGFRPQRLVVSEGSDHAVVESIEIGAKSQLAGQVPASLFAPAAVGAQLSMSGAAPGEEIVLTVSSQKGGSFSASFVGEEVELPSVIEPLVEEAAKAIREADEAYEPGVTLDEQTGEIRDDDC